MTPRINIFERKIIGQPSSVAQILLLCKYSTSTKHNKKTLLLNPQSTSTCYCSNNRCSIRGNHCKHFIFTETISSQSTKQGQFDNYFDVIFDKESFIQYVRKISRKTNVSYPLIQTCKCAYQGVRNVNFSETFTY